MGFLQKLVSRSRRQRESKDMGPAVHLARREPQPKKAPFIAKAPSKTPLFLVGASLSTITITGSGLC